MSVPVFANGNVLFHDDIQRCLDATGADAVMSAEGNLYNPAISLTGAHPVPSRAEPWPWPQKWVFPGDAGTYIPHTHLALEYLSIVRALETRTALSAVKGHLFKLMRPGLALETDLRERLGKVTGGGGGEQKKSQRALEEYEAVVREVEGRMKVCV